MTDKIIEILRKHIFDEENDLEDYRLQQHHQPCILEEDFYNTAADLNAAFEERLREELIKYDEWVFENGKAFADTKESVDEYIEYLKNVKK